MRYKLTQKDFYDLITINGEHVYIRFPNTIFLCSDICKSTISEFSYPTYYTMKNMKHSYNYVVLDDVENKIFFKLREDTLNTADFTCDVVVVTIEELVEILL